MINATLVVPLKFRKKEWIISMWGIGTTRHRMVICAHRCRINFFCVYAFELWMTPTTVCILESPMPRWLFYTLWNNLLRNRDCCFLLFLCLSGYLLLGFWKNIHFLFLLENIFPPRDGVFHLLPLVGLDLCKDVV